MKFIIVAHPAKEEAEAVRIKMTEWLHELGHETVSEDENADLAIVLGGDGFMMHSVDKFSPLGIPCLGINLGHVGFLTQGNVDNWLEVLEKILRREYLVERRLGLELRYADKIFGPYVNDIYLRHSLSMAAFKIELDGEILYKEFYADGMIVSTPTGSTSYNEAAGGPIVQPGVSCLLVTPICSGHLNTRPVVINPHAKVRVEILRSTGPGSIFLIADGENLGEVFPGDEIFLEKHPQEMLFAVFNRHDFYLALQNKKGLMR